MQFIETLTDITCAMGTLIRRNIYSIFITVSLIFTVINVFICDYERATIALVVAIFYIYVDIKKTLKEAI